jgi:uncharacterized protein (TIGR00730 family)
MERALVFCGSGVGRRPEYVEHAVDLGRMLAQRGVTVVYGGASVGLMGALAEAALGEGGEVIGVIPRRLVEMEVAHAGLSCLHVVETMHERKAMMAGLADVVIAMPGGTGTLDELFELLTWRQLGFHRKPIGLLEVARYWAPLLGFLDHAVKEQFLRAEDRAALIVERDATALLDRLESELGVVDGRHPDGSGQVAPVARSPASPRPANRS